MSEVLAQPSLAELCCASKQNKTKHSDTKEEKHCSALDHGDCMRHQYPDLPLCQCACFSECCSVASHAIKISFNLKTGFFAAQMLCVTKLCAAPTFVQILSLALILSRRKSLTSIHVSQIYLKVDNILLPHLPQLSQHLLPG